MLDAYATEIIESNPNMMVPWYLMAAYAYYIDDSPILSDALFDDISKRLITQWDTIEHYHKSHITLDDLEAGTFLGEYPSRIQGAVLAVRVKSNIDTYVESGAEPRFEKMTPDDKKVLTPKSKKPTVQGDLSALFG